MKTTTKQSGFTLVELAIVLVIIGLLVGGVLAGQDLIHAATLQKGIKELTDTEVGASAFRTKYNGLPGDFSGAVSAFSSGAPLAIAGVNPAVLGMGDGDGNIVAVTTAAGGTATATLGMSGEAALFYPELYDAGYIKDKMTYTSLAALPTTVVGTVLPFPTGGQHTPYIVPQSFNGKNYLTIVGNPTAYGAGVPTWTNGLTPPDASAIDAKLDDGVPTTGGIVSAGLTPTAALGGGVTPAGGQPTGTVGCYDTTLVTYQIAQSTPLCNISYRASF